MTKVLHVRKPITINDMVASLEKVRSLLGKSQQTFKYTPFLHLTRASAIINSYQTRTKN